MGRDVELVAQAMDVFDVLGICRFILNLSSQPLDVDRHGGDVPIGPAPDITVDGLGSEGNAGVPH